MRLAFSFSDMEWQRTKHNTIKKKFSMTQSKGKYTLRRILLLFFNVHIYVHQVASKVPFSRSQENKANKAKTTLTHYVKMEKIQGKN